MPPRQLDLGLPRGMPRAARVLVRRPRRLIALAAVAATLTTGAGLAAGPASASAASTAVVDGASTHQTIDGFGFSEAVQRANLLRGSAGLSATNQRAVLDLLFDRTKGAGFSILRTSIGSADSNADGRQRAIAPSRPAGPSTPPQWVWDGSDNGQVWLAQQAIGYGVRTIYADAWSAPGYMKTNGSDTNGGTLCGVPRASCPSGDWRQAYANLLAKNLGLYAQAGVPISHVGFLNEPDYVAPYASMSSDGAQAADLIKVLHSTLQASGSSARIVCCDATGWPSGASMLTELAADPTAWADLAVTSAHGYGGAPAVPLTTSGKPAWLTEWSTFDSWDTAWDDHTGASGYAWADRIMTALTGADVSAFLYWWGAAQRTDNEALIGLTGDSFSVSSRLWAFANYSRFIRPGAVRIGATGTDGAVRLAAFRNTDGTLAVVGLNSAGAPADLTVALRNLSISTGTATPYLTDAGNNTSAQPALAVSNGSFSGHLPARSLVTYQITAGSTPTASVSPPAATPPAATPPAATPPGPAAGTGSGAGSGPAPGMGVPGAAASPGAGAVGSPDSSANPGSSGSPDASAGANATGLPGTSGRPDSGGQAPGAGPTPDAGVLAPDAVSRAGAGGPGATATATPDPDPVATTDSGPAVGPGPGSASTAPTPGTAPGSGAQAEPGATADTDAKPSPDAGGACRVRYTANTWNGNTIAHVTIANAGTSAINGWSLAFALPAGQTITSGWNAGFSPGSGQVTARNLSYDASIPAGSWVGIGFVIQGGAAGGPPTAFALNGTPCSAG